MQVFSALIGIIKTTKIKELDTVETFRKIKVKILNDIQGMPSEQLKGRL